MPGRLLPPQAVLSPILQAPAGGPVASKEEAVKAPSQEDFIFRPCGKKPTALPLRGGRAQRVSESVKGGKGGGSRVCVPSPDPSPCHDYLSICPRPMTI
jgi:hypothetical protein